jgi:hypothetical protein
MNECKKLEVNGRDIYYYTFHCGHPDSNEIFTAFYTLEGKKLEKKWSWRKFRKTPTGVKVDNYVRRFNLNINIESNRYTKSEIRNKIEREVELITRAEEIKRGEII